MGTRLPHHQHYTTPEKGLLQRAAHLTWLWLVLDKPFSSSIHLPEVLDHQMAQSVAARRLHSERKKSSNRAYAFHTGVPANCLLFLCCIPHCTVFVYKS